MVEVLLYRFPGEAIEAFEGKWINTTLTDLSKERDVFVISNADGNTLQAFLPSKSVAPNTVNITFPQQQEQKILSKESYIDRLENLLSEMKGNDVEKVVFSRIERRNWDSSKALSIFNELEQAYPNAMVYLLVSEENGCWIGATPETLIASENKNTFRTMALAGTLAIDENSDKWGAKEREEQAYVSDFIKSAIEEHGKLVNETAVNERIAGPVKHLCTEFTFQLSEENIRPFIQTIHPTPAVCGIPVEEAAQLYKFFEVHDRRLYTGMIGLLSKDNLNIFVNLRCMQCSDKYVDLFVGGGITKDSDPESEWKETVRKSTTLSHYL